MIDKARDPREAFVIMVFLEELIYQCHCVMDSFNELNEAAYSISSLENEYTVSLAENTFGMKNMKDVLSIFSTNDQSKIDALIADARKRTTSDKSMIEFWHHWEKYEPLHRKFQRSIEYLALHTGKLALLLFPSDKKTGMNSTVELDRRKLRGKVLCAVTNTESTSPLANRALRNSYEHYDERLDLILTSVGSYSHRQVGKWHPEPKSQASGFIFDPNSQAIYFLNQGASQEGFDLQPMLSEINRLINDAKEFLRGLSDLEENLGKEGVIKYIDELMKS